MAGRARRRVHGRLYLPLKVRGPLMWPPAYVFRQGLALELLPLSGKSAHCTVSCSPDTRLTALRVVPSLNPPQLPKTERAICFLPELD